MEAIVMVVAFVAGLIALGATSVRWGVDSRPQLPDDHTR